MDHPHNAPLSRLARCRRRTGYTQQQLATYLGVTLGSLNSLERGRIPAWRAHAWTPMARAAAAWLEVEPLALWPQHRAAVARLAGMWASAWHAAEAETATVAPAGVYRAEVRARVDAALAAYVEGQGVASGWKRQSARNVACWAAVHGWHTGEEALLRAVGAQPPLGHPITMEAVRQIVKRVDSWVVQRLVVAEGKAHVCQHRRPR